MATLNDIVIRQELRPCHVRIGNSIEKALFHRWCDVDVREYITEPSKIVPRAIVELESGLVTYVPPERVQFVDNKLSEYAIRKERNESD